MSTTADLAVVHETTYEYGTRVELAHHVAHLTPREEAYQRVDGCALAFAPVPAHQASSRDPFGNLRTFFAMYTPHDALRVRVESRVAVTERFDGLDPAASPAWDEVQAALRYRAGAPFVPAAEFAFASPFVPLHEELGAYAATSFGADRPLVDGAVELMHRLHEDFTYEAGSTEVSTPIREAFAQRRGVCQDFAQVMIGCLRACGLAARYVSGYLLTTPPEGGPRLVGADASHAWVSVWCPASGWVDLDPTNDVLAGTSHVTLAVGRDYGDVMPLRGVIQGGGEHTLTVEVSVERLDAGEPAP